MAEFKVVDPEEIPRRRAAVARSQWAEAVSAALVHHPRAIRLDNLTFSQARALAEEARRRSTPEVAVKVTRRPSPDFNEEDPILFTTWVEAIAQPS
jgi:hypothetical protein